MGNIEWLRPLEALGFKSYKEYLNHPLWKEKSKFILSLNPSCQKCRINKSTQVHHLNYNSVGNENREDVISLCKDCHKKIHGIKDE